MRRVCVRAAIAGVVVLGLTAAPGIAAAEFSKADRKSIKQEFEGKTVYARIDIPHKSGRHSWGTYKAPLVEVTPEGHNTDAARGFTAGAFHADSTYWGTLPNDRLLVDTVSFDDGEVEIELEGVGESEKASTVILFKEIQTVDDLRAAFAIAFSDKPLQDDHPDWSEEIRKAIAERQIVAGMNKRQAFYVVGSPEQFETLEEDGKQVEIWRTRQDRGMKLGFFTTRTKEASYPGQLKFVDGVLVDIAASKGTAVSLDD